MDSGVFIDFIWQSGIMVTERTVSAGMDKDIYDLKRMEKALARISYAGAALGCAALLLTAWAVSGRQARTVTELKSILRFFVSGGFLVIPTLAALFSVLWFHNPFTGKIKVTRAALDYLSFERSRLTRVRILTACIVWAVSFLTALLAGDRIVPVIALGISCPAAFLAAFWGLGRLRLARVEPELVPGGDVSDAPDPLQERRRAFTRWAIYWAVVLALYIASAVIFESLVLYLPVLLLAAGYFVVRIFINPPLRPYAYLKRKRLTVRLTSLASLAVLLLAGLSVILDGTNYNGHYIAAMDYSAFEHHSEATYNPETGVYTIRADHEDFKILQLTDTHIGGSITTIGLDRRAFDTCYDLIKWTQPDLIIITGDLVYPIPLQSFSTNNLVPLWQLAEFMNNVGIPWGFVYGNHDTELIAKYDVKTLNGIFRQMKNDPACPLLYADTQPDIYGRYNQLLRIENPNGSLDRVCFLVDSNDYVKGSSEINDYDSVHADQIDWYRETVDALEGEAGHTVPSFVFMHIPFRAFADAADALERGDQSARYLFGDNGEGVSCPDNDSGFFNAILEEKSTQAVFVGHDHLNNLGVNYMGVDLIYSKSIDFLAYPGIAHKTAQRGGTLITLDGLGGYAIEQVEYTQ